MRVGVQHRVRLLFTATFVCAMTIVSLSSWVAAETTPEKLTAKVRILALHVDGVDLGKEAQVDVFQSQDSKEDLASRFHHGVASDIPYGAYLARVHVSGYASNERVLEVSQPNVLLVMGLEVASEGGGARTRIYGRVEGNPKPSDPIRIRIAGIFSGDIFDTEANKAGEFTLTGIPFGQYVAVATQGGRALGSTTFSLGTSQSPLLIQSSSPAAMKSNR